MICLLDFYDISLRLLSDFRRISMGMKNGSYDLVHGISMGFLWVPHRVFHDVSLIAFHDISIGFL